MAAFNFADFYRAEGLSPGPEIVGRRLKSFLKLRKEVDARRGIDLVRLYFGLPLAGECSWFRDAFAEDDASFSMLGNEREAAVLSACLLAAALEDGLASAGLALLTTAAAGSRMPLVHSALLAEARQALDRIAITLRQPSIVDPMKIAVPAKSKITTQAPSLVQSEDWQKAGELFRQAGSEIDGLTKASGQSREVIAALLSQVGRLREEVNMLWWYVGGWSRLLSCPFSELEGALAAVMAGIDLADLTVGKAGPLAAPAILKRLIGQTQDGAKVTIEEIVKAFPRELFVQLSVGEQLKWIPDVCPVFTALLKGSEVGEAWSMPFREMTHLEPGVSFTLLELAMQVYRERLLLNQGIS